MYWLTFVCDMLCALSFSKYGNCLFNGSWCWQVGTFASSCRHTLSQSSHCNAYFTLSPIVRVLHKCSAISSSNVSILLGSCHPSQYFAISPFPRESISTFLLCCLLVTLSWSLSPWSCYYAALSVKISVVFDLSLFCFSVPPSLCPYILPSLRPYVV